MNDRWVSGCGGIDLRFGRWQDVLESVATIDTLITDTPYSEQTQAGHDATQGGDGSDRQQIDYNHWSPSDVDRFVEDWGPTSVTRGWFVTITDDILAPVWKRALREAGRYVFAPIPFVAPGSRVRLQGDGPSCWCVWIIVARPRTSKFAKWGTLPGAYVLPKGYRDPGVGKAEDPITGGKPMWLMRALARDYSRPGDLICDPCTGKGTTLLAAAVEGRRAIGAEVNRDTYAEAQAWLGAGYTPTLF